MGKFGIKNIWDIQASGSNVNTDNLVTTDTTQSITAVKTFSALPQSSVAPTNNNDLVNKSYVDSNKFGNTWTKIYEVASFSTTNSNTSYTQITNYTNMSNGFTIEANTSYEVLIKSNSNSKDVYVSGIIGINNPNYDNMLLFPPTQWSGTDNDSVRFALYLKNNQLALHAIRGTANTGTWNAPTVIFIRKNGSGGLN